MTTSSPSQLFPKHMWVQDLFDRYLDGERLSSEQALRLLLLEDPQDLQALYHFADTIRAQKVGDTVYFSSTLYLYPTNFCHYSCSFCSFYAKPHQTDKGWFFTADQLLEKIYAVDTKITEVHIVAGCSPQCPLDYYVDLFTKIKQHFPDIHIKALTGIEYDYLAKLHGVSIEHVLTTLKHAHLESIPGGGADLLVDSVRQKITPGRLSSQEFLAIHETAHRLGLRSNITMLAYHREHPEDLILHMQKVRDLQDRTSGFKNFILLKFADANNALGKRLLRIGRNHQIPVYSIFAVARLFLDNIPNIKALWNYLGIDDALQALSCGANDLSSTHIGEQVFQMASSGKRIHMNIEGMSELIASKGRVPCLTNSALV